MTTTNETTQTMIGHQMEREPKEEMMEIMIRCIALKATWNEKKHPNRTTAIAIIATVMMTSDTRPPEKQIQQWTELFPEYADVILETATVMEIGPEQENSLEIARRGIDEILEKIPPHTEDEPNS